MIRATLAALMLVGCVPPKAPVAVSDFCLSSASKKRMWSVRDRPEAIREARVHNLIVDTRCGATKS